VFVSAEALPSRSAAVAMVVAGFRRYTSYRQATFAGAFTNTVFGVIKVSILFAAASSSAGGVVAGYDRAALSTYTWLSQGLIAVVYIFGWTEVAHRVRTGDVAIDFIRPVHPIAAWLAEDLGRAGQACLVRFCTPMVVGGVIYGLRFPERAATVPLFLVSASLGVLVSFGGRVLVNLAAFWLLDVRGVVTLYVLASNVLSGMLVPVAFFPDWLRTFAYLTPFPSLVQVPVDVGVERLTGLVALGAIGMQACWAGALLAAAVLVLRRGERRLVVQGG
jgi:ABC-2 type transport system permease protein